MTRLRRLSIWLIVLCCVFSVISGVALDSASAAGTTNFRAVYYGARCLIRHTDPYNPTDFLRLYREESGEFPQDPNKALLFIRAVPVCVNLPTTLLLVTPFAWLAWGLARLLWLALIAVVFTSAALCAWDLASDYAPKVSVVLICLLAANSQVLFIVGNTAALAVGLCVAAVWCFARGRFVFAGVACLAISLAIKPHDSGLVWLYFVLASSAYRKRAFQSLTLAVVLAAPAVLWVSAIAPQWRQELRSNLAETSRHGDISDPGPDNMSRRGSADVLINLQTVVSVFHDEPLVYNVASFLICGSLLAIWSLKTLRSETSPAHMWLALATVAALSLLPLYHRPYDAKLLMLSVPGCAWLWSRGGLAGRLALVLTTAAVLATGDIPLAFLARLFSHLEVHSMSFGEKLLTLPLLRPAPVVLLTLSGFFLWRYSQFTNAEEIKADRSAREQAREFHSQEGSNRIRHW